MTHAACVLPTPRVRLQNGEGDPDSVVYKKDGAPSEVIPSTNGKHVLYERIFVRFDRGVCILRYHPGPPGGTICDGRYADTTARSKA